MLQMEDLIDKKPSAMSGGQRQRVAMGRAIVRQPQVFLMDEPLSNLDAKLRVSTRAQIAALQKDLATTMVYVTHDQTEAMTLGDRVCVLNAGILQQVDTPKVLYDNPGNTFVATFIGSPAMTLLDGIAVEGGRAVMGEGHTVDLGMTPEQSSRVRGDQVIIGLHPEDWIIEAVNREPDTDAPTVPLDVLIVEQLGAEQYAYCHPVMTPDSPVTVRGERVTVRSIDIDLEQGDRIYVRPRQGKVSFFDKETEINLNYL